MMALTPEELLIALRAALQAAQLQLEYLDERFPTGTTPPTIAKIEAALRASLFADGPQAADTIERLQARVEAVREHLECAIDDHDSHNGKSNFAGHWTNLARAVIEKDHS